MFFVDLARGFKDKCLHEKKAKVVEKVGGCHSTQPTDHVAWPTGHNLAPNRLLQVGGAPHDPINTPYGGNEDTIFW
jgi:hypothetical protein